MYFTRAQRPNLPQNDQPQRKTSSRVGDACARASSIVRPPSSFSSFCLLSAFFFSFFLLFAFHASLTTARIHMGAFCFMGFSCLPLFEFIEPFFTALFFLPRSPPLSKFVHLIYMSVQANREQWPHTNQRPDTAITAEMHRQPSRLSTSFTPGLALAMLPLFSGGLSPPIDKIVPLLLAAQARLSNNGPSELSRHYGLWRAPFRC